jgi:hypothetical protein
MNGSSPDEAEASICNLNAEHGQWKNTRDCVGSMGHMRGLRESPLELRQAPELFGAFLVLWCQEQKGILHTWNFLLVMA